MKIGAILAAVCLAVAALAATYWIARADSPTSAATANAKPVSEEPTPSKTGPHPQVVLPEEVHDFGVMKLGDTGEYTFVVRNEGEAPLKLGQPRTTCQCTVSEAAKRDIPPGGEGTITLEWKPESLTDAFDKGAIIRTNDPDMPEIRLAVVGKVDSLVRTEPQGSWHAGEFTGDQPVELAGYVYSSLLDDLQVEQAESENPLVTAVVEPVEGEEAAQYGAKSANRIRVTLSPGLPVGKFEETLVVKTNVEEDGWDEFEMTITGTRLGPIQILPTPGVKWNPEALAIDLGRFPASKGASGTVTLFVSGLAEDEELKFESVETSEPFVEVDLKHDSSFQVPNRQRYELTFEVPPGVPPVSRRGKSAVKVNVKTNHPDAEQMKFFVQFISAA